MGPGGTGGSEVMGPGWALGHSGVLGGDRELRGSWGGSGERWRALRVLGGSPGVLGDK